MRRAALAVVTCLAAPLAGCPDAGAVPLPHAWTPPPSIARYLVGGDSRNDAKHVLAWAFEEAKLRRAAAFLFLGDMEITPGYDGHFEEELGLLGPVPFYPVLGNHEVRAFGVFATAPVHDRRSFRRRFLETPRTPVKSALPDEVVYSVDLPGGVHFVALDNVSQRGFGDAQLAWLAGDLRAARADRTVKWIVVGMHEPLAHGGFTQYGMEGEGARAMADSDAALALMKESQVSLILMSHLHVYAEYAQGGIPAYITGGLGAPLVRAYPGAAFHHFLQLDVEPDKLRVSVVRFPGESAYGDDDD